jgi:hypothetical protein
MTVYIEKPAVNLREELASLRNQGGYQEQQFWYENAVTNGTFDADTDWTKGTGWTISGGVATTATGTSGTLSQSSVVENNRLYAITYTVSGYVSGGVLINFYGGSGVTSAPNTAGNGTYTVYLNSGNNTDFRVLKNGSADAYSIDNISVFEVDANDDVIHRMPKGWKPKDVFEDGLLQREGAAHDYEVVYDGFDYVIKPTVAPSTTTQTCVIGVKA